MAKRGPKKKYKPEYDRQAFIACKKGGLIDLDLAELFGVCEKTIYTWKNDYPSFKAAVQEGKDYYDCAKAEESLKKGQGMKDVERNAISRALASTGGNRRKAAKILGIGERTLYRKIKEYGLK